VKFVFLGIVQGLTEFLPVSSSGHLYIIKNYLAITQDLLPFFVFLHLATLAAIFVFLHKEILSFLSNKRILFHLGLITVITASLALLIDYYLVRFFESRYLVPFLLLVNGGILLLVRKSSRQRVSSDIRLSDSIFIGILQGFSILPGISRSGITIIGLLNRGFKEKEAFGLSFLMATPLILGVFIFKAEALVNSQVPLSGMIFSAIAAFLFSLLALSIVRKTLINKRFNIFGYYCIIVSLISLIILK